jgi:dihydroflavonol-4-reductase
MKVLVTGATGFVGFHVAKVLKDKSLDVRALVREESDISNVKTLDVELFRGDIRDYDSICRALKGCRQLYHVAADYRLWVPDPKTMYEINVQGTRNVMEAALQLGIEKVVYTSTVGVLARSSAGKPSNEESHSDIRGMVGHYERSKFLAEREVHDFVRKGVPIVIVNPSTPIGTMDKKPTPTGKMILDFVEGKIPAYVDTGLNFVDVEDVALGHWLASVHGRIGERYILGNKNIALKDFFRTLAAMAGCRPPKLRLPYFPVLFAAHIDEAFSKWIIRRHPRIPVTAVKMAREYMYFDCSKAVEELKIPQNPIEIAMGKAIGWFEKNENVGRG